MDPVQAPEDVGSEFDQISLVIRVDPVAQIGDKSFNKPRLRRFVT
jgi:hypothetical protein